MTQEPGYPWWKRRLMLSLQALVAEPEAQLAVYPKGVCKVDELALDFDHLRPVALERPDAGLSPCERDVLAALDRRLDAMSGPGRAELRRESALSTRREWADVRTVATAALLMFGWPVQPPPPTENLTANRVGPLNF